MTTRAPIDLRASVQRVAQGGIPLRAEERLAEERGAHARLFTSDLTVPEFLLSRGPSRGGAWATISKRAGAPFTNRIAELLVHPPSWAIRGCWSQRYTEGACGGGCHPSRPARSDRP